MSLLLWFAYAELELEAGNGRDISRHEGAHSGRTEPRGPDLTDSLGDQRRNSAVSDQEVLFQRDGSERLLVQHGGQSGSLHGNGRPGHSLHVRRGRRICASRREQFPGEADRSDDLSHKSNAELQRSAVSVYVPEPDLLIQPNPEYGLSHADRGSLQAGGTSLEQRGEQQVDDGRGAHDSKLREEVPVSGHSIRRRRRRGVSGSGN